MGDQTHSFSELLRRHRVAAGLTQEALAERAGLSRRGIADLERGVRRAPYRDTVTRLTEALDLNPVHREELAAASRRVVSPPPPPPGARDGLAASSASTGEAKGLLERSDQLAALDGLLLGVLRTSRGRFAFLGGEAGAGKSALVRHFCATHANRAQVLAGACDPLFTPRALGPLLDVAQVTGGELRELTERGGHPYQVVAALMSELRARDPAILVLEDVHWADEATLDVMRLLGRRIENVPALVVATYRDDELDRAHPLRLLLGELPSGEALTRLHVAQLSRAAVARLARPHGLDASDVYRKTSGNAFFVTEILTAGDADLPGSVRDAVLARAARLGVHAGALLQAVAVVPPLAEVWLLERVASDVVDHLEACLHSGMLTAQSAAVAFRHELARLAIEESITPVQSVALHRRVLDALADPPGGLPDPARLAHHAEAANDPDAVVRFASAAGGRASLLGAHRQAAAQYARALRFAQHASPAIRADLLERQAQECFLTDQVDVAIDSGWAAVAAFREAGDRGREAIAMQHLSHHLRCAGQPLEAARVIRSAVELVEHPSLAPGRERAMTSSYVASMCMNDDDADGAALFGQRALELANDLDATDVIVHALNTVGTMELLAGDVSGLAKLERSLALAQAAGLHEDAGRAFVNMGWASARSRTYAGVEEHIQRGLDYCNEHQLVLWRHNVMAHAARAALDLGRWSDAVAYAQRVVDDTQVSVPRVPALIVLGLVRARRGDGDCWSPLDEALALAQPSEELQFIGPVAAARAEAAWLEGRTDAVDAATASAVALAEQRRAAWVLGELACWRWRAGIERSAPDGLADPYALEIRGDWQGAAEAWTKRGCVYDAALALASAEDDAALRNALSQLQRLDAHATAGLVVRRLRDLETRTMPG